VTQQNQPFGSGDIFYHWGHDRLRAPTAKGQDERFVAGSFCRCGDLIELHLAAVPPRDCIVRGWLCDGGVLTNGSVSYRSTLNGKWTMWDDLATVAGAPIVIHQMFPEFVRQDVAWYLRALGGAVDLAYREVVHAADCDADGNCPWCKVDFAECPCPGPTSEDTEFITHLHDRLWGKPMATNDNGDKQR